MEIFDGHQVTRVITQEYSLRLVEAAPYIYIGKAKPSALESEYSWQIKRMDESTGLKIQYPDGDERFNRRWTDYATLSYL